MKIMIIDSVGSGRIPYKTTKDIIEHYELTGHEVRKSSSYGPDLVRWADVVLFEWCDNNVVVFSNDKEITDEELKGKKIINRVVDIDAYAGHYNGVNWSRITNLLFMSKHIQSMVNANMMKNEVYASIPQQVIPLGINMDKWTFKDRSDINTRGYTIGFFTHMWEAKGFPEALEIINKLIRTTGKPWVLKCVGTWSGGAGWWAKKYFDHFVQDTGLEKSITHEEYVEDINAFYQECDYFLHCSLKDSFSLVCGEAMACGLKTPIHSFWGAREIWPEKYIWNYMDDAVRMITEPSYDSNEYRKAIEDLYSIDKINAMWDSLIL